MSATIERVSPCDLDAERAILGAVLVDERLLADVRDALTASDFFRKAHQTIFSTLCGLSDGGVPIDALTVTGALGVALAEVGGAVYLHACMDGVPRGMHVGAYCRTVKDTSTRRRLQQAADEAIREAGDVSINAAAALDKAQRTIADLAARERRGDLCPIENVLADLMPVIGRVVDTGRPEVGLSTGFWDLDRMTLGLHPGNLVLLASRPAMGKSALALNIAYHVATVVDQVVAFFSLEMSRQEIGERLLGAVARVEMHQIMQGRGVSSDITRIGTAHAEAAAAKLWVDDTSSQTVASIRGKCRRLVAKHGLGLVVVDYLQLLGTDRRYDNRVNEVGAMSRELKQLAGELEVPVLCLSQLNRASEARTESRPRISDLRESGSLEQDANTVWLLHRPEEYQATPDNAGLAELIVGKNRKGPTGVVQLTWSKQMTRFDNQSDR